MGQFNFEKTAIEGVYIITPRAFADERGFFMETYNAQDFAQAGLTMQFVQDNHSKSSQNVLRGLHMQVQHPQCKLVRVIVGEVFDVAVDLRQGSKTFGKWVGVSLSAENKKQLLIPEGFAHGFYVTSPTAEFVYKCTDYYHPEDEDGICYNDPEIAIDWPICPCEPLALSPKDAKWGSFAQYKQRHGIEA